MDVASYIILCLETVFWLVPTLIYCCTILQDSYIHSYQENFENKMVLSLVKIFGLKMNTILYN